MSKVRVNFLLPQEIYRMVNDLATEEGSSAADIYRKAVRKFLEDHHDNEIKKLIKNEKIKEKLNPKS